MRNHEKILVMFNIKNFCVTYRNHVYKSITNVQKNHYKMSKYINRQFIEGEGQRANRYVKKYSNPLVS